MKIGDFSVRNPVFVNIFMFALLALGALTLIRMPREQYSEVPFYFANIAVPWPGVSAQEIEKRILIPIEEEMQGLEDVDKIISEADQGIGAVSVRFQDGISQARFDKLFQDVDTRFSRVELPEGTLTASLESFSSNDFIPVIEVVLFGDVGYDELVRSAELLLQPMRRIPDVADVEIIGSREKRLEISADRTALESRNISLDELVAAVQSRHINVPGGTLETENRDYLVRTVGEAQSPEAFGEVVVRRESNGGVVRLRDVASVQTEYDPQGAYTRFNGNTSVVLRVTKVPRGGSVKIIESVKNIVEEKRSRISGDIGIAYMNDSSIPIRASLDVLQTNALLGLVLLVGILYFFVGLRNALITGLGIPVTFAVTLIILDITGATINSNTLFGLVLVLGMLVDHAIVITENSFRLQQSGLSRRSAAVEGTDQVAIPVIAASATTVAAFLPLILLPGLIGKFLRVIPVTVTIALIVSTAEALFFLPSHYADWPSGRRRHDERRFFSVFLAKYRRLLEFSYHYRRITVPAVIILVFLSFALIPFLGQDLFSAEDYSVVYIDITMPPGSPIEKTDRVASRFEERLIPLIGNGEVEAVAVSIGFLSGGSGNTAEAAVAQITVDLSEKGAGRERSVTEVMADLKGLTDDIAGADRVLFRKATTGPPTDDPIEYRIFGDSYDEMLIVADRIRRELAEDWSVVNIEDNYKPGTPELTVRVNEERAASYGLSVLSIGRFLRASVEGVEAASFFKDNTSLDILVRFSDSGELSPALLQQLRIPTFAGTAVPFSAVAAIESGTPVASIKRLDGRRELTISAQTLDKDRVSELNRKMQKIFDEEYASRYPGVELSVGGEFAEFSDLLIRILRIFLLGIFLIYIILGTQFKSYLQPFLILFTVPMAFFGVVIYLFISGTPFSTTVLYAGVALAGIAVNDAIVLISFANKQRSKGISVNEAVIEAALLRFRPIILTSLTTIAGLVPTALGLGGRSVVWGPMASTIIIGLLFSTVGTLVFIPALYGMFFDRGGRKAA